MLFSVHIYLMITNVLSLVGTSSHYCSILFAKILSFSKMGSQFVALSIQTWQASNSHRSACLSLCLSQNWVFTLFCFEGFFHSLCISTVSNTYSLVCDASLHSLLTVVSEEQKKCFYKVLYIILFFHTIMLQPCNSIRSCWILSLPFHVKNLCAYKHIHMCHAQQPCEGQRTTYKSQFSPLNNVCPGDLIQAVRLGGSIYTATYRDILPALCSNFCFHKFEISFLRSKQIRSTFSQVKQAVEFST